MLKSLCRACECVHGTSLRRIQHQAKNWNDESVSKISDADIRERDLLDANTNVIRGGCAKF